MGVSLNNMAKILKCMGSDDILTMKVGPRLPVVLVWKGLCEVVLWVLIQRWWPCRAAMHGCGVPVLPAPAQAEDQGDSVTFMFEAANQERISDFELKLMDIDSEQ